MAMTVFLRDSRTGDTTPIEITETTTFSQVVNKLFPDSMGTKVAFEYEGEPISRPDMKVVSTGISGDGEIIYTASLVSEFKLGKTHLYESTDEFLPLFTEEQAKGSISHIHAITVFADQGWGNKKGRILLNVGGDYLNLTGIAEHQVETRTFDSKEQPLPDFIKRVQRGDTFRIGCVVGGGGGHQLKIQSFRCEVSYC
eukprot:TRINITY_DN2613_c1_g1_i1.p2 TRINITY_DN2613_c1_g1~~TRINITY_DN2613_c1_g1_i1.p2  ORF type:complete len:213 (+),score=43.79 TRINITY_DN2613_c1_g1_i1:46-639(+)